MLLSKVTLFTQGLYGCEVSADAPSWDTQVVRRRLHVLVEPVKQPVIVGVEPMYKPGQFLKLSCISENTYPAANITWYLDGEKIESAGVSTKTEASGLITTSSHLNSSVYSSVEAKCLASL